MRLGGGSQTELQQQAQNEETQSMYLHAQLNRRWCTEFNTIGLQAHVAC